MTAAGDRLSSLDASFLYLEQPNALMHIGSICTFDRMISFEELLRYVESRLPLIPRYTQRVAMIPLNLAHPVWEEDPQFSLRNHILRHRLKASQDKFELADLCSQIFAAPLDRTRPLWEMHLIDDYGTGCALLIKVHHCMIDGAGGVQLLNLLLDPAPNPSRVDLPAMIHPSAPSTGFTALRVIEGVLHTASQQIGAGLSLLKGLRHPSKAVAQARATVDALGTMIRTVASQAPSTPFNGAISRTRRLAWVRFSLNEVKAIKNRLGGTINDVVLSVISGALRQYMNANGIKTDRMELRAMVPVNMRGEHEAMRLGNRVSLMIAPLPIGIADPLERLRQVAAAMEMLKTSGQASQVQHLVDLTDLLPPFLQAPLVGLQASINPVNTVCTNVPGLRETRYLLGTPVKMMAPIVPLAQGVGLGFAILSYADQITIGINADAERISDTWQLAEFLSNSFEELWAITGLERIDSNGAAARQAATAEPPVKMRAVRGARASRTKSRSRP